MERASKTQAPATTHAASARLVHELTDDFNTTMEEETESAPPATEIDATPTADQDPTPTTKQDPAPTTKQDPTPTTDQDPTHIEVDPTLIMDSDPAPIMDSDPAPANGAGLAPVLGGIPTPTDKYSTTRSSSVPPSSGSELTQLSDTDSP